MEEFKYDRNDPFILCATKLAFDMAFRKSDTSSISLNLLRLDMGQDIYLLFDDISYEDSMEVYRISYHYGFDKIKALRITSPIDYVLDEDGLYEKILNLNQINDVVDMSDNQGSISMLNLIRGLAEKIRFEFNMHGGDLGDNISKTYWEKMA